MELIQYGTTTEEVRAEPLLIVPSVVNKFYLTDLTPGRSLVEFAVGQGRQTFGISWRNPGPDQRHLDLDAYIAAIIEALERSSRSPELNGRTRWACARAASF